ncbi:MAG: sugar-binding transcriptional regulator [Pseudodonghicola sp.]
MTANPARAKEPKDTQGRAVSPERAMLMLRAVEMYFLEEASRSEIGDRLGISRFKVARLLKEARELGMVNISIARPDGLDPHRSDLLRARWNLPRSIVVPTAPDDSIPQLLAEAAASYLDEHVTADDVLGLSSGRTTSRIARLIKSLPHCTIVQIAGVASATSLWENPTETIRRMTQLTAGPSYPIFAPIVLSTGAAAEALRNEPGIAEACARFDDLTRVVITCAPWVAGESMIHDSVTPADQALVAACAPAGEVLANVLDAEGRETAESFTERALAISIPQLKKISDVILVAGGQRRHDAILACMRAGIVDTLITDSLTAQFLIDNAPEAEASPAG